MYVCTCAPTEARRGGVSLSRWNCRLLCDIWCGCWKPNFRSFPRAANVLNHWALSQPRPSPLFIIKRKTDTFFTFFVSFTENGIFLTNVDSVGHRYSSHDNGYIALETEHQLCTPQNRPSMCNTSWHCITTWASVQFPHEGPITHSQTTQVTVLQIQGHKAKYMQNIPLGFYCDVERQNCIFTPLCFRF